VGLDVLNGAKLPAWYHGDEFAKAREKTMKEQAAR
jgi:hypothetical protein